MEYEKEVFGRLVTRLNGKYHSYEDKPSLITINNEQYWHKNGSLHRDGNEPAIIDSQGKFWYKNGLLHRDNDGPAIIYLDGLLCWYKHGEYHRDNDLPAIIHPNSHARWYINGKFIKSCNNYRPRIKSARNNF